MEREAQVLGRRGYVGPLLALLLAAFLLGGVLAWVGGHRRCWLFPSKNCRPSNARRRSATSTCTPPRSRRKRRGKACRAISRRPENEQNQYYALRAQQRLAELYLQNDDLDQALRCYEQLADAERPTCSSARSGCPVKPMSTFFATNRAWPTRNWPPWSSCWIVCRPKSGR